MRQMNLKLFFGVLISLLVSIFALGFLQAAEITYSLPGDGRVSLNIYNSSGAIVRELLHAVSRQSGRHTENWDGLDNNRNGLPAGSYTWKTLYTPQGLTARYVMSVGSTYVPGNSSNTACGPGCHVTPYSVAVDGTGMYVSAHTTENAEFCMLKQPLDGSSRTWSAFAPAAYDGALSLAVANGELYMLGQPATYGEDHQNLYVYEPETGTKTATYDIRWNGYLDATDMDVNGSVLVVAYKSRNAIRWYNPSDGTLLDTATVTAPEGVTVGGSGTVYVTTGTKIYKLTSANHTLVQVVTGLSTPKRLDYDHTNNRLFVYVAGAGQVRRYSSTGSLQATYGVSGGRPEGFYNTTRKKSFCGVSDIASDGAGGFFVAEPDSAPRRVARFNSLGTLLKEWYGGQRWALHAQPDPDNPDVVWMTGAPGWIMRLTVNYTSKTWTVHSCYKYQGLADGLVTDSWNEGGYFKVLKHNGVTYLAIVTMGPTLLKVNETNWKLVPVTIYRNIDDATPQTIKTWAGSNQSYQWNDSNSDGFPQQGEVTFYASALPGLCLPYPAPDFTHYFATGSTAQFYQWPVNSWNGEGAPVYAVPSICGSYPTGRTLPYLRDGRWCDFFHQDPVTGEMYDGINVFMGNWGLFGDSFLQKWDANKNMLWQAGTKGAKAGQIQNGFRSIAGLAHDCIMTTGFGATTFVWDKDGLWVGGILEHPDLDGIAAYWYEGDGEYCHTATFTHPTTGKTYFYGNWINEMRLYEITGWDNWSRSSGGVTLTAQPPGGVGSGLWGEYFDTSNFQTSRTWRVDATVDFNWGEGVPPGTDVTNADTFSVRWSGKFLPPYGLSYFGPWAILPVSIYRDGNYHDGTSHTSDGQNAGVYAECKFRGVSVKWFGRSGPYFGKADVSIDGGPAEVVDCYSPIDTYGAISGVPLYTETGLSDSDHTIRITCRGDHHPESTGNSIVVDYFEVGGGIVDDWGEAYSFQSAADDGMQLLIDGQTRLIDWCNKSSAPEREAEKKIKLYRAPYDIQVNYYKNAYKNTGQSVVTLSCSSVNFAKQIIPQSCLYPVPTEANPLSDAVVSLNCGGGAADPFAADGFYSGGTPVSTTDAIGTDSVANVAPEAVYQSGRAGASTYTIAGLQPGGAYEVRLHFAEFSATAPGQRQFDVQINGAVVLDNYDIYADAGSKQAVMKCFSAQADAAGNITLGLVNSVGQALINGLVIIPNVTSPGLSAAPGEDFEIVNWDAGDFPGTGASGNWQWNNPGIGWQPVTETVMRNMLTPGMFSPAMATGRGWEPAVGGKLIAPAVITSVAITPGPGYELAELYRVAASDDGAVWTTITEAEVDPSGVTTIAVTDSTPHCWWAVVLLTNTTVPGAGNILFSGYYP